MSTIADIRARADAATPGPWERDLNLPFSNEFMGIFAPGSSRYVIRAESDREDPTTRNDAVFLAAARADIPALLAIIDAAREKLRDYYRSPECRADVEAAYLLLNGDEEVRVSDDASPGGAA